MFHSSRVMAYLWRSVIPLCALIPIVLLPQPELLHLGALLQALCYLLLKPIDLHFRGTKILTL